MDNIVKEFNTELAQIEIRGLRLPKGLFELCAPAKVNS